MPGGEQATGSIHTPDFPASGPAIQTTVMSRKAVKKASYHHGNLRVELINAGLAIVEEHGVDAVSLRAVARRAKVSHNAPYHHFANKAELLAALAAAGFERMVGEIRAEIARISPASPLDQLRALGKTYISFAAANPSVFRLMFRPELTHPSQHPVLQGAEARAFGTLMELTIACQQHNQLPAGDPFALAVCAWSTVHGLSTLRVEQVLQETPLGAYDWQQIVHLTNEFALRGLAASGDRLSTSNPQT
jgi:AcrR family transcriptional regulator